MRRNNRTLRALVASAILAAGAVCVVAAVSPAEAVSPSVKGISPQSAGNAPAPPAVSTWFPLQPGGHL